MKVAAKVGTKHGHGVGRGRQQKQCTQPRMQFAIHACEIGKIFKH